MDTVETATVAEQEYLEIMFWLEEAGLPMTGANIARAMQLSPPTVHEMIGRLTDGPDSPIRIGDRVTVAFDAIGEGFVESHGDNGSALHGAVHGRAGRPNLIR